MGRDLLDGGALGLDGGVVAARDRPGQRPLGAVLGKVLDRARAAAARAAPAPRAARARRPAAIRSAAAWSVTRKFEATEAAAWYAARPSSSISKGVIPSRRASRAAKSSASALVPATAQPTPVERRERRLAGRGQLGEASGAGAARTGRRRPAAPRSMAVSGVAPLVCPTSGAAPGGDRRPPRRSRRPGRRGSRPSAGGGVSPRPSGPSTSTPAARRAALSLVPSRPAPMTATRASLSRPGWRFFTGESLVHCPCRSTPMVGSGQQPQGYP